MTLCDFELVGLSVGVLVSPVQNGDKIFYTVSPNRIKGINTWNPLSTVAVTQEALSKRAQAPVLMKLTAGGIATSDTRGCSALKAWMPSHGTLPRLAPLLSGHHSLPPYSLCILYFIRSSFYPQEDLSFPLHSKRN